jgi:hypothetical protein
MSGPDASMGRAGADASGREHRLRFRTAKELFDEFPAARQDMQAQPTVQDCLGYLSGLAASATPEEAITFAAYLLPPREAVWWAHQCLHYIPDALTEVDHQMLAFAEAWVREPEEETRNTALEAANDAETETPGVWVAFAAGWSGGTMGPLNVSPIPPPPFLTPRAVNAAVLGLLARVDTDHRDEILRGFVEMAVKLTEA